MFMKKDTLLDIVGVIAVLIFIFQITSLVVEFLDKIYPFLPSNIRYYYSDMNLWWPFLIFIFFPSCLYLIWFYKYKPEKRYIGFRKWVTYPTLLLIGFGGGGTDINK